MPAPPARRVSTPSGAPWSARRLCPSVHYELSFHSAAGYLPEVAAGRRIQLSAWRKTRFEKPGFESGESTSRLPGRPRLWPYPGLPTDSQSVDNHAGRPLGSFSGGRGMGGMGMMAARVQSMVPRWPV